MNYYRFICFLLILIFTACSTDEHGEIAVEDKDYVFHYLKPEVSNVLFSNELENSLELNILNYIYYYNGGGVTLADFNNDGLIDIYFTGNETSDKLYLNLGKLKFRDITQFAGIDNGQGWTNGSTTVDINNDGFMDLYICKTGSHLGIKGHNLLYINKGLKDSIPIFEEQSAKYGLDVSSYSTQSAFFDYDLDGDLDMYLLNHSVHPNTNYGKGAKRKLVDSFSGDKLFENIDGQFVDVTANSGIYQGSIGYGLGMSISDINSDGHPDIYIGNDFFENDYLYLNQQNKTFKDLIFNDPDALGHTTHFSMGNTVSDLNNDLLPDILSLDMLPENLYNYKTSGLEFSYPIYQGYLRNGYNPQYMQNTFHLNRGDSKYSEMAYSSGIAATEWSWAPLSADFNNDGFKDLYITNGILGATNDMDFINFISNEKIQAKLGANLKEEDLNLINELPEKKVPNYFYQNENGTVFKNKTSEWIERRPSFSNGASYADLDNDGDLDLVVNNVNDEAYIIENKSEASNNYLKISFKGSEKNVNGIGAKVVAFLDETTILEENYTTNGYLSSKPPILHFGLGQSKIVDSVMVIWPNQTSQTVKQVQANTEITFNIEDAQGNYYTKLKAQKNNSPKPEINFTHDERGTIEFNRNSMVPFVSTNEGPDVSVADYNNNGLEDFFISGAKGQASALFQQQLNGTFNKVQQEIFEPYALNEDVSHTFSDLNNDGWLDLIVASGGNEFASGKPLQPRVYINVNGELQIREDIFKGIEINASKIATADLDKDGFQDIVIASDSQDLEFGKTPKQYIFKNNQDLRFTEVTQSMAKDLQYIGNIKDFKIIDLDSDGDQDMVVVGHWMPISIFINNNGKLELEQNSKLKNTNGWWNAVAVEDFDQDGDLDIVAGNWGLNSRLKASFKEPITLYNYDFDKNGKTEPLVTSFYDGTETPFASKDELVKQMPFINKKYLSYSDFALADIQDIFGAENLRNAPKKKVFELASCFFENEGNLSFKKHKLPQIAQISAVFYIHTLDVNNDGFYDIYLTGNNFEISTQLSRLDASHGELLTYIENTGFQLLNDNRFRVNGAVRDVAPIKIGNNQFLIVARNNNRPLFLNIDYNEDEK